MSTSSPQLAIVIPTYRWDALAKETLTQAAAIGCDDIVVHIGDNSANPEKHAYLRNLAERSHNVVVSCHSTNIGADSNWLHLIKAQTAPYICMAADDDSFSAGYFRTGLALVRDDFGCATASGLHISIAHSASNTVPAVATPSERLETTALDRLRNYRGQNSICYAISSRPVIRDFAHYVEVNPLQCPFNDYMLAFHLLSMGTYRMDRRGYAYIYDNSNWQLNDAFIQSNARWYQGYNLPESFAYLTRLHWAVVAVHFFASTFRASNLTKEQAEAIISYLFDRQRSEFASDYHQYKSEITAVFSGHAQASTAFARLRSGGYDQIAAIFDDFAKIVSIFSPSVATKYRAFQASTLQSNSGQIHAPARGKLVKIQSVLTQALKR